MTREEAKELLPIIQAFAEGKTIEIYYKGDWSEASDPDFTWSPIRYRIKPIKPIKPESKYRPFKNKEECWLEMLKHQPFGWVKHKRTKVYRHVYCVTEEFYIGEYTAFKYKNAMKLYTFADGTPFGVKYE